MSHQVKVGMEIATFKIFNIIYTPLVRCFFHKIIKKVRPKMSGLLS